MDISADAGFVICWGLERLVMTEGSREKVSLEKGWDMPLVAFGLCSRRELPWVRLLFAGP